MSRRVRGPRTTACTALLVGLALPSCGPGATGPLESTDEDGVEVCVPQDATGRAVITTSEVRLDGARDVTVTSASLVRAEGLELIGYDFGPFEDGFAVNGGDDKSTGPPTTPAAALQAGESYAVKLGLAAESGGGSAAAVDIEYRIDGGSDTRTVQTRVAMVVAAAGEVCS